MLVAMFVVGTLWLSLAMYELTQSPSRKIPALIALSVAALIGASLMTVGALC